MEMNGVVLMSIKICCEKKVPNRLHFLKWSQELFADFFDLSYISQERKVYKYEFYFICNIKHTLKRKITADEK